MNIDQPQGMTRERFLKQFPTLVGWVEGMEKMYGPFLRCGSLILSNRRVVLIVRFEQIWHINFDNPANRPDERERTINLSTEAIFAVIGLTMTFMGHAEYQQSKQGNHMTETEKLDLRKSLNDTLTRWLSDDNTPNIGGYEGYELARSMADAAIAVLEASSNVQDYLRNEEMLKD